MLIDKRKRFIISSFILSSVLVSVQLVQEQIYKFGIIGIIGILSIILFWWSLREGLRNKISLLILILPIYYSVGSALFWFLLPNSVWITIIVTVIYGISIYVLFLTSNVYSVSYIKTIALYRAAKGVGFLLTLVAFFLTLDGVISLRLSYLFVGLLVFILTFPLYLQGYWTSTLQSKMDSKLFTTAIISSLLQAQVSIVLFFWPVGVIVQFFLNNIILYLIRIGPE